MRPPIDQRAFAVTAADIAATLGGARRSGQWWSCRCPAHDDRMPSLSVRDGDRGLLVRCWSGCDPRDVLAELRRRGLIGGQAESRPKAAPGQPEIRGANDARRIAAAMDLWSESYRADGTIVERYLRSRGITLPPPATIRMHGMMAHRESGEQRPAMVALVEHTEHGPTGVHIAYLAIDGSMKATIEPAKRSLGPVAGAAVRLAPAGALLMVAEGIETGLAAMQACQLPVWAALSTSGMKALVLPPVVRTVIILADHDVNGAGERAARAATDRWLAEGRRVRLAMPPEPGSDFNDVLVGRAYARTQKVADVAG
jgi:putative DNA primase/helicase